MSVAETAKKKEDPAEEPKAEGAGEDDELLAPKPKFGKKKLMIIGAVGMLIVLLGGGGAAYYFSAHKEADAAKAAAAAAENDLNKPVYFPLGDLLVNLSGEGKHPNFLKVKISLQLADEKDLPLMEAIKPRIIDNFQVYLRELRIEDLRGSAGMYRLREELLMRVTEAAQPVRIRDVLFQEMLVQ
jgi:flagellar FliL protein